MAKNYIGKSVIIASGAHTGKSGKVVQQHDERLVLEVKVSGEINRLYYHTKDLIIQ